ncbi:hypothetical protein G6F24_017879 [Rhizopus arrhizus]|nr:hypothetical protein G6F24_017879 [Rhizopus arrhizus]
MDGSARIVYLDLQIGEQCMQNANDITIRLLIVDDSGENAEAIVSALRNSGIAPGHRPGAGLAVAGHSTAAGGPAHRRQRQGYSAGAAGRAHR